MITLAREDVHIIPVSDIREHYCSRECWCGPTEDPECDQVVIHNSMDRREEYERGRRLQ